MKITKLFLPSVLAMLLMTCASQAKEWHGITPLHSTRADVERLIGRPNAPYDRYDLENERVSITYSRETCTEGAQWNVPRDTVIQINVVPKQRLLLADLKLDPSRYERIKDPEVQVHTYYLNREEGVRYDVFEGGGDDNGLILNIYYEPAARDARLRCSATAAKSAVQAIIIEPLHQSSYTRDRARRTPQSLLLVVLLH